MTDTDASPSRNATVEALRKLSGAFDELAIAISVIAREGAIAAEVAETAGNAAEQAVTIAREVRDLAKKTDRTARSIDEKLEAQQKAFSDFFGQVLGEFGALSKRIKVLEDAREEGANGHG